MRQRNIETLTRGGLLLALVALLTAFVKVPLPVGYAHLGDGPVILAGLMLGPFGAVCAAAGTVLADLISGFPFYIPFSVVIKGLIAWLAHRFLDPTLRLCRKNLTALFFILLLVPVGYFPADALFYGLPAALAALPGNLAQAAVGYAVSALLLGAGVGGGK